MSEGQIVRIPQMHYLPLYGESRPVRPLSVEVTWDVILREGQTEEEALAVSHPCAGWMYRANVITSDDPRDW